MPLEIVRNDITRMQVDAIVNAANHSLLGGGGVDGAIHRAAGPMLLAMCRMLGGCATGEAKITPGFRLPSRYIIHTVGPVWHGGAQGERALLASCYRNSLNLAKKHRCQSIAFPMISTGAYGFPADQAMRIAVNVISEFLLENEMQVYIVVFSRDSLLIGEKLFAGVRQYIDDHYADEWLETEEERRIRCQESYSAPAEYLKSSTAPFEDAAESGIASSWLWRSEQKPASVGVPCDKPESSLEEMLGSLDESFSQMLLRMIDERGMTDAACYKRANISRKLFSKIRGDVQYRPSKRTAVAFAVALELSLEETRALLERAGFALSHSSKFDVIVEYFIIHKNYDIFAINEALFSFDQPLLGG